MITPVRFGSFAAFCAAVVALLHLATAPSSAAAPQSLAQPSPGTPGKLSVLTSFLPIHSLTLGVAGDRAEVQNWIPAGVDPHDFQFSPRDLRRLRSASVLVIGGLGLEGWSEEKLRTLSGNPQLRIIDASAGIPANALIEEPCAHDHGHAHDGDATEAAGGHGHAPNPHFWLDPLLMAHAVTNLLAGLREIDPAGSATYARNAAATVDRLHQLHQEFERKLAPCRTSAFITYHNAFPYLSKRYGLRMVGVVESGPSSEPTARQLVDLGRVVRSEKVSVLFMDGEPPRLAKRLATDFRIRLATLETLERGAFGPTAYEDGMRRNLEALVSALQPGKQP